MEKYRLKQWYPSLPPGLKDGMIIEFDGINSIMGEIRYNHCFTDYSCEFNGLELKCTQFWELIEEQEPLFTTEDGVEIFAGDNFIMVEDDFTKHKLTAYNVPYTEDFKGFKHEPNADTYIWKNKPVFSYNDVMEFINLRLYTKETIEHDAKERSKE